MTSDPIKIAEQIVCFRIFRQVFTFCESLVQLQHFCNLLGLNSIECLSLTSSRIKFISRGSFLYFYPSTAIAAGVFVLESVCETGRPAGIFWVLDAQSYAFTLADVSGFTMNGGGCMEWFSLKRLKT